MFAAPAARARGRCTPRRFLGEVRGLADVEQMLDRRRSSASRSSVGELLGGELADRLEHPEAARSSQRRTRLLSTSDSSSSTSASQTRSAAVERPAAAEDRRARASSRCSSGVEQLVRPLDRRAQRPLPRLGVAAAAEQVEPAARAARAAARSSAPTSARRRARARAAGRRGARTARRRARRGRKSGRARAARARRTARRASARASAGTGYTCSPWTRSRSRLVTSTSRPGHAPSSADSSGAASITCSKLSSSKQQPAVADRLGERSRRRRALRDAAEDDRRRPQSAASGTHQTPCGYSSAAAAAACSASRVLPLPPGPGQRQQPHVVAREQRLHLAELVRPGRGTASTGTGRFVA